MMCTLAMPGTEFFKRSASMSYFKTLKHSSRSSRKRAQVRTQAEQSQAAGSKDNVSEKEVLKIIKIRKTGPNQMRYIAKKTSLHALLAWYDLPRGLESSLKLDIWRICPLCEQFSRSSLKVGSPSLSILWITISVFNATCRLHQ